MIFATLVFTVVAFWPERGTVAVAQGSPNAIKDINAIRLMVSEWITFDWLRITLGFMGLFLLFAQFVFLFR